MICTNPAWLKHIEGKRRVLYQLISMHCLCAEKNHAQQCTIADQLHRAHGRHVKVREGCSPFPRVAMTTRAARYDFVLFAHMAPLLLRDVIVIVVVCVPPPPSSLRSLSFNGVILPPRHSVVMWGCRLDAPLGCGLFAAT